ncbi:MAG: hypothetical protein IJ785_08985 [Bacteroidales bacterium]|nr:hypothetical protein [Bacteroidales bacterium]
MVEIRTFTVGQIGQWLEGDDGSGLSESVITRTRARAIVHNPYAKPDDPVVATVIAEGETVAFTALFPDRVGGELYYWFSTLWCHPDHRGKGYALIAVGTLMEHYTPARCLDSWAADETIEIFKYFGHQTHYFPQYKHTLATFKHPTLKQIASYSLHRGWKPLSRRKRLKAQPETKDYTIQYVDNIDPETAQLIHTHSGKDLLPRSAEMLDWIMQHPFLHTAPLADRTASTNPFPDNVGRYWISGVKIIRDNKPVAFYIIRQADSELSIKYLYYCPEHKEAAFGSIIGHILQLQAHSFTTRSKDLSDYVVRLGIFSKATTIPISYSLPTSFPLPPHAAAQGGDGDAFV